MPLLDRNGLKADSFSREAEADGAVQARRLVPLADIENALKQNADTRAGVEIPNTTDPASLLPHFNRLNLIAIAFPAYTDGRGFSIARRLRDLGYRGTIRAVGPLIADQLVQALACGIDEIEISEAHLQHQPIEDWRQALRAITNGYQSTYGWSGTILEQRRAAREKLERA